MIVLQGQQAVMDTLVVSSEFRKRVQFLVALLGNAVC